MFPFLRDIKRRESCAEATAQPHEEPPDDEHLVAAGDLARPHEDDADRGEGLDDQESTLPAEPVGNVSGGEAAQHAADEGSGDDQAETDQGRLFGGMILDFGA